MVRYINKEFRKGIGDNVFSNTPNQTVPVPNTTDEQGNNSFNNELSATSFLKTFEDVKTNIESLQTGQTDKTWGEAIASTELSNWISLKQFLLYLCTRYTPQSLVPFVELIPYTVAQNSTGENLNDKNSINGVNDYYESIGEVVRKQTAKEKAINEIIQAQNFGVDANRYDNSVNSLNKANKVKADLFSLDPFAEEPTTKNETRNLGYRVYSQLVLSPDYVGDTASKPGAIGFTSFEIKAGASSENGLALISMTLLDVQGNKFIDINSPWSFIFDVRAGNLAGDFYFRYGWQIRVPDPGNNQDVMSKGFWGHEGWKLFGDAKKEIQSQLRPELTLMLTQSINQPQQVGTNGEGAVVDANYSNDIIPSLFDEGVHYDPVTGMVDTSKKVLGEPNYIKLSILNPKIDVNQSGGIEVTLNFRTTGSVIEALPLAYADQTKRLVKEVAKRKRDEIRDVVSLTDLILAVMLDNSTGSLRISNDVNAKDRQRQAENSYKAKYLSSTKDVSNLIYVTGAYAGIENNNIDPNKINLKIDKDLSDRLFNTSKKDSTSTLLKWLRDVLAYNECALLSAATGSGSGINSTWIIATTREITEEQLINRDRPLNPKSKETKLWERISSEKDVFSFRFQGSLVEELRVEKVEKGNAAKVQADNAIEDFPSMDLTSEETALKLNKPVTPADKSRNLLIYFSQVQGVEITAMCHPWTGPGKRVFVKGMGFYDGEYMVLEVTHSLTKNNKFITKLKGVRMLIPDKKDLHNSSLDNTKLDNLSLLAETANEQYKYFPIKTLGSANENLQELTDTSKEWVTLQDLKKIVLVQNSNLSRIVEPLNEILKKYNINNYLRICHFLAQTMEETGGYKTFTEDLRYSSDTLLELFSNRVSRADSVRIQYNERLIAYKIYGNRSDLGNLTKEDGWVYKGRGIIQVTGKSNYNRIGKALGIDLVSSPELLEKNLFYACDSAGYYWSKTFGKRDSYWEELANYQQEINLANKQIIKFTKENNYSEIEIWKQKKRISQAKYSSVLRNPILNKNLSIEVLCDFDQVVGITRAVNGGEINLETRRIYLERAKKALVRYMSNSPSQV